MYFLKKVLRWWRKRQKRKRKPNSLPECAAEQQDIGVRVTRIRLPSGAVVVLVQIDEHAPENRENRNK